MQVTKLMGPQARENAALFPTIWSTSSKTQLLRLPKQQKRSTSYNKVFQFAKPISFKPTTLPSTINHQPSTHLPWSAPPPVAPLPQRNENPPPTDAPRCTARRRPNAPWPPCRGKTRGRMSYMTCFEVRFQGQKKNI